MQVTDVIELGPRDLELQLMRLDRKYQLRFYVETDDPRVGPAQVLTANLGPGKRIPRVGEPLILENEFDDGVACTKVLPEQDKDFPKTWLVTAHYESETADPSAQQGTTSSSGASGGGGSAGNPSQSNPLYEPPTWQWGEQSLIQGLQQTKDPIPELIVNSAQTPYDPPPPDEVTLLTLTFERNEREFRPYWAQGFKNSTNEKQWQLAPPGNWLCKSITAGSALMRNRIIYYRVRYLFVHNELNWKLRIIDKGPDYFDSNGAMHRAMTPTGQGTQVNLNGFGGKLPDGQPPNIREFTRYKKKDFNELKLPDIAIP
ncbi:MAG: hypothetical protein ACJ8C4_05780 [Gemmataceae bacterium]